MTLLLGGITLLQLRCDAIMPTVKANSQGERQAIITAAV